MLCSFSVAGWGDDDEKGGGTDIEDDWGDMVTTPNRLPACLAGD